MMPFTSSLGFSPMCPVDAPALPRDPYPRPSIHLPFPLLRYPVDWSLDVGPPIAMDPFFHIQRLIAANSLFRVRLRRPDAMDQDHCRRIWPAIGTMCCQSVWRCPNMLRGGWAPATAATIRHPRGHIEVAWGHENRVGSGERDSTGKALCGHLSSKG
jgi:hypothetical protein